MSRAQTFAFESDFVASLRCIPMAVRFKLDRCGVKLTLRQWSRFTREDREALLVGACGGPREVVAYRAYLVALVQLRTEEAARDLPTPIETPWEDISRTPQAVSGYASSLGLAGPSDRQWASLSELQRFVLVKLSRDNHDNVNFVPALREFGLVD